MKIVRYELHGHDHVGIVRAGKVHSLPDGLTPLDVLTMPMAERNLLEAQAGRQQRVPLDSVRLLAPIEPRALRDFVTFEAHIAGMKKSEGGDGRVPPEWFEAPAFLFGNPWSFTGPFDDLPMPPDTTAFDFELEIAAIVGEAACDVSVDEAARHIVGYAILNDWSARDTQGREMRVGLGPSKGKDFANTLGPWITSADELAAHRVGDRLSLEMSVAVNGQVVGTDNAANMSWSFEELLSHAARGAHVGPGDVLASGTCAGGALAEIWSRTGNRSPRPLEPGDVVTMTVEALGSISNRIVEPTSTVPPVGPARRTYSEAQL